MIPMKLSNIHCFSNRNHPILHRKPFHSQSAIFRFPITKTSTIHQSENKPIIRKFTDHYQEAQRDLRTVRDIFRFSVTELINNDVKYGQGTTDAFEDARLLLAAHLKIPVTGDNFNLFLDSRLTETEKKKLLEVLKTRIHDRVPMAYATKTAIIGDDTFFVDERVLIPRSQIGELFVQGRFEAWVKKPVDQVTRCLDLCTGSGYLAIYMASVFPNATIDAVDISRDALDVAAVNVKDYSISDRVNLIQSNMFEKLKGKKYDIIISNPPYVTKEGMAEVHEFPEFQKEPNIAFYGGEDGLDFVRKILKEGRNYLENNSTMIVEAGRDQKENLEREFPEISFSWAETSVGCRDVFVVSEESFNGIPYFRGKSK